MSNLEVEDLGEQTQGQGELDLKDYCLELDVKEGGLALKASNLDLHRLTVEANQSRLVK